MITRDELIQYAVQAVKECAGGEEYIVDDEESRQLNRKIRANLGRGTIEKLWDCIDDLVRVIMQNTDDEPVENTLISVYGQVYF